MFDLKRRLTWSGVKVSLVTTLALLLVLATVMFAGNLGGLFSPMVELRARFRSVEGLRPGSPVWLAGVEVGSVSGVELTPAGPVVSFRIREELLARVHQGASATVETMGLLGDKYLKLHPGSERAPPVEPGELIRGAEQPDLNDLLQAGTGSMARINVLLERLDQLMVRLEEGDGTVPLLLRDPALYSNLEQSSQRLAAILQEVQDSDGTVSRLVESRELYEELLSVARSFDRFGKMLALSSGSLEAFVTDPALHRNLVASTRQLHAVLQNIQAGEGLAAALLHDQRLRAQFVQTLSELNGTIEQVGRLVEDIRRNPKRYFDFSVF